MGIVKSQESTLLELQVVANPDGAATPNTTVAWKLTDELFAQMEEREFHDPHLLLIVASVKDDYYSSTKIYSIRLGTTKTPKQYIQFSRAGDNVVIATIIDIKNVGQRACIKNLTHGGATLRFTSRGELCWDGYLEDIPHLRLQTSRRVHVDSRLFPPPPPQWLKRIVRVFYRGQEDDECHFRKRALASIPLMIGLQLYGVLARLAILLFALATGKRGITLRSFFALHPHDFALNLGDSFWTTDSKGNDRPGKSIWWWINPISLLAYAGIIAVLSIPGALYLMIFNPLPKDMPFFEQLGHSLGAGAIIDPILAFVIFVIWLNLSRNGRRARRSWMAKINEPLQAKEIALQSIQQRQPQKLNSNEDVLQLPDATVSLRFNALKAKVCRPYQR